MDNYHYLSQDPNAGTSGIATGMMISNQGWTYSGTVCWPSKKERTGITEVFGPVTNSWNSLRVDAAEVIALSLLLIKSLFCHSRVNSALRSSPAMVDISMESYTHGDGL